MRKLLNTIYVTNENAYLTLKDNNLVCKVDGEVKVKIPFDNIENVVCFSYLGCSPALMGKCVEKQVPINFISPSGKFWAKVCGETKGNVFLRVAQIDCFRDQGLLLSKNLSFRFVSGLTVKTDYFKSIIQLIYKTVKYLTVNTCI